MTDDRPAPAPEPWPEPPGCPSCGAPNQRGAEACWVCGAELMPADPGPISPTPTDGPASRPEPGPSPWPRPRLKIATLMIVIAVLAVGFAVGQGKASLLLGLVMLVGPSVGYLVARARRVERGGERPSAVERTLG